MRNRLKNTKQLRLACLVTSLVLVPMIIIGFVIRIAHAEVGDDLFRVNVPYAFNSSQNTNVFLEIAQTGTGVYKDDVKLDAPEAWAKYYIDANRIDKAVLGIYNGDYGGNTDVLGSKSGMPGVPFGGKNTNAVRYDFYLAEDTFIQGIPDERPCLNIDTGEYTPSATRYSSQMLTNGWYKDLTGKQFLDHSFCNSKRWHATKKSGKYVIFVRASWANPQQTDSGGTLGRLNAFKVGAAYSDASPDNKYDNPITGYWSYFSGATRSAEPDKAAYAVQDRISDNGTFGDYEFDFAADCRLAVGQTEERFLHWKDIDYPDYYVGTNVVPEFTLVDIDERGNVVSSTTITGNDTLNGKPAFNGKDKENIHNYMRFQGSGGHRYRWIWKNIIRKDGIRLWLPYDDYGYYKGCGNWNHDFKMQAGIASGGLGTSEFRIAGGQTALINMSQFAKGENIGPETKIDLTVAAANDPSSTNKSIATTFSSVRASLNGRSSCDKTISPNNTACKSTPYSRVVSWSGLGGLGPSPLYTSSRTDIYAYFDVRPDAPDGARYCASAIMSPKSNTNPGGLKSTPEQICFIIDNSLKPYISTTGADVHAGDCNVSSLVNRYGDITGPPATQGNNGSVGLYIVSAADTITNFGSGGSAISNTLTFGNGGKYGCMRRPTMRAVQDDVKTAEKNTAAVKTVPYSGGANSVINLSSDVPPIGKKYVIEVAGNATVVGTSPSPVTINAPNGTVTIAGGSFGGDAGKVTDQKNLPVVMVIAKDIDISKDVKNITALLYAENTIDTCSEVARLDSSANVNACKNLLTLNGFAMANNFSLKRTTGSNGLAKAEDLVFNAAFYLNPPVGGGAATSAIKYLGERAPLY